MSHSSPGAAAGGTLRKFLPRNCFVIKFVADMGKAMKFYRDVLAVVYCELNRRACK